MLNRYLNTNGSNECQVSWTAEEKKIILKLEEIIEFCKYLYAGRSAARTPYKYQKYIPEMGKTSNCFQLSSSNFRGFKDMAGLVGGPRVEPPDAGEFS